MMPEHRWLWRARLVRIVDGDTLIVTIDKGMGGTQLERVRLLGVDTPEIVGATANAGRAAKAFTGMWLSDVDFADDWPLLLETHKPKERDSFGRWLAEVWRVANGRNLTEDLIAAGHGVRWV